VISELLILERDGASRRFALSQDLITIGRSPHCDIAFPATKSVSRQHAALRKSGNRWALMDLGSRQGTFVNGETLRGEATVRDGDRIQIGEITLIAVGEEQERPESAKSAPAPPASTQAVLFFPGQKMRVSITDPTPFAFGRASTFFRAETPEHGMVCVKLFSQVSGDGWPNSLGFEREVLAQSNLRHPNVLPILDFGLRSDPHGSPFLILPYCECGSLRRFIRSRSYHSYASVRDLIEQIAQGLDAAHAAGIVHGDVKPENVLLADGEKRALISDFGMSSLFAIQERFTTKVPGEVGGTTNYLSPEQISQGQQTALSDIYAFALVVYELLAGRLPFDADQPPFRQMLAKVEGRLLDPRLFSPLVTDGMKDALFRGLSCNPLERPRSAVSFCRLLAERAGIDNDRGAINKRPRGRIFVSYSHRDHEWLEKIRIHLRPLEREGQIDLWDDTRIRPGAKWLEEIESALTEASCAVLVVSPHFLASDFCAMKEVPALLRAARDRGLTVLSVIASPCRFEQHLELVAFQAVNAPSRTLSEMSSPECDRVLLKLAEAVERAVGSGESSGR
jgi:serine/threonine protein kinase